MSQNFIAIPKEGAYKTTAKTANMRIAESTIRKIKIEFADKIKELHSNFIME
jgi:hypothetical protein